MNQLRGQRFSSPEKAVEKHEKHVSEFAEFTADGHIPRPAALSAPARPPESSQKANTPLSRPSGDFTAAKNVAGYVSLAKSGRNRRTARACAHRNRSERGSETYDKPTKLSSSYYAVYRLRGAVKYRFGDTERIAAPAAPSVCTVTEIYQCPVP
ncbi:hypothetical protein EVAR_72660_1 [Eumeta japonica]|uniref:Uncharacterized protein n=1 Tax=Eumeta variegata TaxID=151549 RepID=A0A4C1STL2_EUMVA|nr:hypothetical protein EVAR_72660_1 [Eumeta japonica]